MTNNDILKKLRVALQLRNDDIVEILKLVDFRISASELGAFFRSEDHPKYKNCGDQVLRNFLNGLVIHMRGPKDAPKPKPKSFKEKNQFSNAKKRVHKKPYITNDKGEMPKFKAKGAKLNKKKKDQE